MRSVQSLNNDEMELVSPEVKEAHSGPSNMDDGPDRDKITEAEEEKDQLLKVIGQQKVEIDFLKNALR